MRRSRGALSAKAIDWRQSAGDGHGRSARHRWPPASPTAAAVEAPLAVAADGRDSLARQAAGIATSTRSYPQSALVLNFAHSREHGFISTEFHTETGPFTQVPLPGNRSSLVWVVKPETAEELAALDDAALSRARRGADAVDARPRHASSPAGRSIRSRRDLPARFAKNRIALVGEAAHVFPPIGAQGLNLGIRDVEDIVRTAARKSRRSRQRRPRFRPTTAAGGRTSWRAPTAVNLLNISLLSDMLPAQLARSAGLGVLGALRAAAGASSCARACSRAAASPGRSRRYGNRSGGSIPRLDR